MRHQISKTQYRISLLAVFLLGVLLRVWFSPDMNYETDSFPVMLSAKSISETGQYTIPPIRLTDTAHSFQSNPGWAVGYALLLSSLFLTFGYSETIARLATITISALAVLATGVAANRICGRAAGIASAVLVAVNPLLLCLNGRILTANLGFAFLTISFCFLVIGTMKKDPDAVFLSAGDILKSKERFVYYALSFLFWGFTVLARDDFAMFVFIYFIFYFGILIRSLKTGSGKMLFDYFKLIAISAFFFLAGYLPNLYFNFKTYGRILTSSHYEYGGRLSLDYFLSGSSGAMGLPGWFVIIFAILIYALPAASVILIVRQSKAGILVSAVFAAIAVPIVVINGAYAVTSSGAVARYILPLIPIASISAAIFFIQEKKGYRIVKIVGIAGLVCWHGIHIYPPVSLFEKIPKTLYLTQYSPWYNRHNYENYPHPVRSTLDWVRMNTPANAIILSDYDAYHYFFYTGRDVMDRQFVGEIKRQMGSRPIFFVENHQSAVNPELTKEWKKQLAELSMGLDEKGSIPLFSPVGGKIRLKFYKVVKI